VYWTAPRPLAAVLAAIIVKRIVGAAMETVCDAWGQQVKKIS
jgi:hypothetical protein